LEEGIVVQSMEQRHGRGRHGRTWHSPIGNLYMSVLLRPTCDVKEAGQLAFIAANAVSGAIDEIIDKKHTKTLKWPNDILINGQKACGILIEKEAGGYALGMGVNIIAPPEGAVGLNSVTWDIQVPIHPFRDKVLAHLSSFYDEWQQNGFAKNREQWLKNAHGLNKPIKTKRGKEDIAGIFRGLGVDGALQIEVEDGTLLDINAGEVYFPAINNKNGDET